MNPETLAALQESIEHWKRLASGKRMRGEDIGIYDCTLCRMFNRTAYERLRPPEKGCDECPVKEKTGEDHCKRTPYVKVSSYYDDWNGTGEAMYRSKKFQDLCADELAFLRSLLPKLETPVKT